MFAFGLIHVSIKGILRDILLTSLNISHKADIPKTQAFDYIFVTLLFSVSSQL